MTNTIVRRALQLLGRPEVIESGKDLGWVLDCQKHYPDGPDDLDTECPVCDKRAVALQWDTWDNLQTGDWHNVDHWWCPDGHMWTYTHSSYSQRVMPA